MEIALLKGAPEPEPEPKPIIADPEEDKAEAGPPRPNRSDEPIPPAAEKLAAAIEQKRGAMELGSRWRRLHLADLIKDRGEAEVQKVVEWAITCGGQEAKRLARVLKLYPDGLTATRCAEALKVIDAERAARSKNKGG